MNRIVLTGRLVRDVELAYLSNGTAKAPFTIAVDSGKKDNAGNRTTYFFDGVAWGTQAEYLSRYTSKGNLIGVDGSLQQRSYQTSDGNTRYVIEINCERVENLTPRDNSEAQNQSTQQHSQSTNTRKDSIDAQAKAYGDTLPIVDDKDLPF